MTERRIRVYRDGDRAVLADIVNDSDYEGIVRWTWLHPEAAIEIGEAMAAIGRGIIAAQKQP